MDSTAVSASKTAIPHKNCRHWGLGSLLKPLRWRSPGSSTTRDTPENPGNQTKDPQNKSPSLDKSRGSVFEPTPGSITTSSKTLVRGVAQIYPLNSKGAPCTLCSLGRFDARRHMCLSSRPGPSAGKGGPGTPRSRRTALRHRCFSKSGWGTGWPPSGCQGRIETLIFDVKCPQRTTALHFVLLRQEI